MVHGIPLPNSLRAGNDGTNLASRLTLASLTAVGESSASGWSALGQREGLRCSSEAKVLEYLMQL